MPNTAFVPGSLPTAYLFLGLAKIRDEQRDDGQANFYISLSASAAFLASVTATTLGYPQVLGAVATNDPNHSIGSPLVMATIAIWYASIACAVTSALLSLLALFVRTRPT